MKTIGPITLALVFAGSLLATPLAFADEGGTSAGGTSGANAGSSSNKTDKSTQENAASADKDKQK